jgi:glutamine synthetase
MFTEVDRSPTQAARVLEDAERQGVEFVNLQFTDILGMVKSVSIPIEQLPDAIAHGKWFDGSAIEGFARVAESDMFLVPDLSTFAVVPWQTEGGVTARVICWVFSPNGEPFAGDPRTILATTLAEARALGYGFHVAPELEFYLFRREADGRLQPHDRGSYFDLATDLAAPVRHEMVRALKRMGIRVETAHHEVGGGQHEIDFEQTDALRAADQTITCKHTARAIAQRHGLLATFMPKPLENIIGSGMHIHQSLFDVAGERNLFSDPDDDYGLTPLARAFIAGQLAHARALCAVVAPLVNSYQRLVPGFEAPVYVTWAHLNREALVRVPKISPSQPQATRIELRSPDSACNPYLAFAVLLAAGLDGIRRGLPLPPPVEENLYYIGEADLRTRGVRVLPDTLAEALDELERDEVIRAALGGYVCERLIEAQRRQWSEYRRHVSSWELDRYLDVT